MDPIIDLRNELDRLRGSQARLQRVCIAAWCCLAIVLILGATQAANTTRFAGDVEIGGRLTVAGKVNGVEVTAGEIRLGMMVPYFGDGDKPPRGYCWADGKTQWPDAEWVPSHLRRKNVPEMNGELLGGTSILGEVGIVSPAQSLNTVLSTNTPGEVFFWKRGDFVPDKLLAGYPNSPDGWAGLTSVGPISLVTNVALSSGKDASGKDITISSVPMSRYLKCRWLIRIE